MQECAILWDNTNTSLCGVELTPPDSEANVRLFAFLRQIVSGLCACLPQVQTLNFVVVRDDAGNTLDTDAYARSWEAFVPKPVLPAGVPPTMPSRGIRCRES